MINEIKIGAYSDKGNFRKKNEDSYLYKTARIKNGNSGIFVVADGVGGCKDGEIASQIAIEGFELWWEDIFKKGLYQHPDIIKKSLLEQLFDVNQKIVEYSEEKNAMVASTFSLILLHEDMIYMLHIGDSSIYQYSENKNNFQLLSVKQTTPPPQTMLTHYLGSKNNRHYQPICQSYPIEAGENICIIGSDGGFNLISEEHLLYMLKKMLENKHTCSYTAHKLGGFVQEKGEKDNVTLLVLQFTRN